MSMVKVHKSPFDVLKHLFKANLIPLVLLALAWSVISPPDSFNHLVSVITTWLTMPAILLAVVLFILPYLELYKEWQWLWIATSLGCMVILIAYFTGGVL